MTSHDTRGPVTTLLHDVGGELGQPLDTLSFGFSQCRGHGVALRMLGTPCEAALRATSHTRLRAHYHYTSSTLMVEKAELVQVHFTLRLRDQRSMCMQDECKVYADFYKTSNGSCSMVTQTLFKKPTSWR